MSPWMMQSSKELCSATCSPNSGAENLLRSEVAPLLVDLTNIPKLCHFQAGWNESLEDKRVYFKWHSSLIADVNAYPKRQILVIFIVRQHDFVAKMSCSS